MSNTLAKNELVNTTIGQIPESHLSVQVIEQSDGNNSWVVARECHYLGGDPKLAEHVGKMVRRDVWVTVKGLEMTGQQGG